ncbi:MAG TPA: hypothetical protein VGO09_04810 [Flavisolibacter sp.]|nr:hypothetical protein [Flavisolibacter sp.]
MKFIKFSIILLFAFISTSSFSQSADDIINKHIAAIGGKEKINQIKTIQIESVMNVMGNEAPMTTTVVNGKGFKNELDFGGTKIVQVYTDKGGWSINPMMGISDAQAMPEDQYKVGKDEIYVGGPLIDYAAKGHKVELKGTEKINNVEAYKIVLTTKDNETSTYYFDPSTYYILKLVRTINMAGQEGETSSVFSDYRKTDYGYVVPYSVETTVPQVTMTTTVKKVEVNKDLDPKIFDMPKQ